MPAQTTNTSYVYFPDGCKVEVMASGDVSYTELGAINSAVTATLNWTESQLETANAGKLAKRIKEMKMEGGFTLINLNQTGIQKMSGGAMTLVTTAGAPAASIVNQVIAAGWADNVKYALNMVTSSTDSTLLRMATKPALTSVTCATTTPEVLVEDADYVVMADPQSSSGWSIQFISSVFTQPSPKLSAITIVYASNTPVAKTTLYAGTSGYTMAAYKMKFTHTDSASKTRVLELFSVESGSGAFQFNFKGASDDGVEEMPLTYSAKIDTSLTDGRQLFAWSVDTGAQ